ncbi:hypothetical protein DNTS_008412 [Danionella cerebrum]|uniref:Uncharacterized protein n=1 Tax=Danionella cerebrum TaxID=2873325 RepID=A0A553MTU1_9TELE|nr:hypothetical protein DNTS_008412 [Danionella translucida]
MRLHQVREPLSITGTDQSIRAIFIERTHSLTGDASGNPNSHLYDSSPEEGSYRRECEPANSSAEPSLHPTHRERTAEELSPPPHLESLVWHQVLGGSVCSMDSQ